MRTEHPSARGFDREDPRLDARRAAAEVQRMIGEMRAASRTAADAELDEWLDDLSDWYDALPGIDTQTADSTPAATGSP